jgi:hypothetical protein
MLAGVPSHLTYTDTLRCFDLSSSSRTKQCVGVVLPRLSNLKRDSARRQQWGSDSSSRGRRRWEGLERLGTSGEGWRVTGEGMGICDKVVDMDTVRHTKEECYVQDEESMAKGLQKPPRTTSTPLSAKHALGRPYAIRVLSTSIHNSSPIFQIVNSRTVIERQHRSRSRLTPDAEHRALLLPSLVNAPAGLPLCRYLRRQHTVSTTLGDMKPTVEVMWVLER